jgi:hypothetical protein
MEFLSRRVCGILPAHRQLAGLAQDQGSCHQNEDDDQNFAREQFLQIGLRIYEDSCPTAFGNL